MKISMDKKYRTRDGRDVRLLCVDGPEDYPVIGIIEGAKRAASFSKNGETYYGSMDSDLIEYHEPDIRTIWVNVYEDHMEMFYREGVARQNVRLTAISIAQPVTFEVKK